VNQNLHRTRTAIETIPGADELIIRQATWRAARLVRAGYFKRDDLDDLRQDLALDCIRRAPKFNRTRGGWQTFLRIVIRNRSVALIARERCRASREVLAWDLRRRDESYEEDSPDPLDEVSDQKAGISLESTLDIRRVLVGLPAQLLSLSLLLAQMPVTEVCQHTGKSRATVHRMTVQLRAAFLAAGFGTGRRRSSSSCVADRHPRSGGLPTPKERTML
jgi:RNA polymerase sigma-70 factor (ECF subfamily)